jgi:hypothetical protein
MGTVNFKIGEGIGNILLRLSQEKIMKGDIPGAYKIYTDSLINFPNEYIIQILRGELALEVSQETQEVFLINEINKKDLSLQDWDCWINSQISEIEQILLARSGLQDTFDEYQFGDLDKFYLGDYFERTFGKTWDILIVPNFIQDCLEDTSKWWTDARWERIRDSVESNIDSAVPWEIVAYSLINYKIVVIDRLLNIYKLLNTVYPWLLENNFIKEPERLNQYIELVVEVLLNYSNSESAKNIISETLNQTKWMKEYLENGTLKKNILDGYDAGWLAPNGDFYGANGETSRLLHMNIAIQLQKGTKFKNFFDYTEMPERVLESNGWIKIHHNCAYGYFVDSEPTEEQITAIHKYAKKFYSGKIFTRPGNSGKEWKTSDLIQMDKFALREAFELI